MQNYRRPLTTLPEPRPEDLEDERDAFLEELLMLLELLRPPAELTPDVREMCRPCPLFPLGLEGLSGRFDG